jgi:hypothetical protein
MDATLLLGANLHGYDNALNIPVAANANLILLMILI